MSEWDHTWEKWPHESMKAYRAFCVYRDLGPDRSLRKALEAGRAQGVFKYSSVRQLAQWSRKFHWVSRSQAYDLHLEAEMRRRREREIREMNERHAKLARALQAKAVQRLNNIDPRDLSSSDILRYVVEASKLERLAMGEPETIQEQRGDWTQAVLLAYEHLRAPAQQRDGGQGRDG